MSKQIRDLESLRQNDNDLMVQYEELLCLRAQLASLLFPLKRSRLASIGLRTAIGRQHEQCGLMSGRLRRHLSCD